MALLLTLESRQVRFFKRKWAGFSETFGSKQ
jgi:hypothetical protein